MGGFMGNLAAHWWIILLIVLLVFGATRLPQLAKGIGQSINILKKEVKSDDQPGDDTASGDESATTSSSTSSTDKQ